MICKECGAYNPDHATYCKVCAANLKGEPAAEAPEVREEEQPTKRFSRPSWVAPEQVEQTVTEAVEPVQETVAEVKETVAEAEAPVEDAQETVAAAADDELWTPVRARRSQYNHTEEETAENAEEKASDYNDENEGIYNDEEALEEEDDSFEYEPTPPKRKQQKKKSNTMFSVLLIAIIVVIIGILVAGGLLIAKKKGCFTKKDTTVDQQGTSEGNEQQGEDEPRVNPTSGPNDQQPSEQPSVDTKNAQIQKYVDNGVDHVAITVKIPSNATLTITLPHQPDYQFTNTDSQEVTRKVKIPIGVFNPNEPLTEATREITPQITVTAADGSSYTVNCPSFTYEYPKLNISVGSPVPNEKGIIMASESNEIKITGTIDEPTADITINGNLVQVYEGGMFVYDFKFPADAGEDDEETLKIVATKDNYVTDEEEITIHAYKFVPEDMVLEVRSEGSALRADTSGKLTVTGKTLPGSTLTAVSDNTTNVLCGSVTVDGEGNFSFQVTMDPTFYGMSTINLSASKEGATDGSTSFKVLRGFKDKDSFLKYYNKTKTYIEISPKKTSIADLLANQTQYASNTYGFRITAIVVEVINKDGDIIVKMTNNKTEETIYVHNLSEKWAPADNVGGKYNVYCNFVGTYEDTGCCEFLGWFAKKP